MSVWLMSANSGTDKSLGEGRCVVSGAGGRRMGTGASAKVNGAGIFVGVDLTGSVCRLLHVRRKERWDMKEPVFEM